MTTYYVDATLGNDGNAGTSELAPWKSYDPKVNGFAFNAGDFIKGKKDEEWREQLLPPSDGASGIGNEITFDYYGSGAAPKLNGSDLVNTWTSSLLEDLKVYYNMDEESDGSGQVDRADSVGSLDLTDENPFCASTDSGKISRAADFSGADRMNHADHADLSLGADTEWAVWAWIYPTVQGAQQGIVCKHPNVDADREYGIMLSNDSPPKAQVTIGNDTVGGTKTGDEASLNNWHLLIGWYDSTAQTINIQVDDGAPQAGAWVGGTWDGAAALLIGDAWPAGAKFTGRIDEIGIVIGRILTATERAALYNSGDGMTHPFTSSTVWQAAVTTEPFRVFFDDTKGNKQASLVAVDSEHDWYWAGNILYVYSTTDPDSAYNSPGIEASIRDRCIYVDDKDYITIDGVDVEKSNGDGNILMWNTPVYTTIKNLTTSYAAGHGVIWNGNNHTIQNVIAEHNGWEAGQDHGLYPGGDDWLVEDCTLRNNIGAGLHAYQSGSGVAQYNNCHDNGDWGLIASEIIAGKDVDFFYNLSHGNGDAGLEISSIGAGSTIRAYNNVFYANVAGEYQGGFGIFVIFNNSADVDSIILRNNISLSNTLEDWEQRDNVAPYLVDYNCYYRAFGTMITYGGVDYTQAQFANYQAASGQDANGISADPLFNDPANDNFTLQPISPCINAGVDVGLNRDFDGAFVPQGLAPDIGAYEFLLGVRGMRRKETIGLSQRVDLRGLPWGLT